MKNIYTLSDEELVKVALDSESISTALSRKGDFNIQKCMVCAMDNIGRYFRGSIGLPAYASLDKDQKHELTLIQDGIKPKVWEAISEQRTKRVKQHTITAINFARASGIISEALSAAGLKHTIYEQRYRARVEVRIGSLTVVRFYVKYKDLEREEAADEMMVALRDLQDALQRLGPGVFLRRI